MNKLLLKILIIIGLVVHILYMPTPSFATIAFDANGKWGTTFDCADQSQANTGVTAWLTCDDMSTGGNWTFFGTPLTDGVSSNWSASATTNEWYYTGALVDIGYHKTILINESRQEIGAVGSLTLGSWGWGDNDSYGSDTVYVYQTVDPDTQALDYIYAFFARSAYQSGDSVSSITSSANNADGSGGKGFRTIDGDGSNMDTGPGQITFTEPQKELWIRWYQRYELGYKWDYSYTGDFPVYDKMVYLWSNQVSGGGTQTIAELRYDNFLMVAQSALNQYPLGDDVDGYGWSDIMATGSGAVDDRASDGLYHCYEIHIKMDVAGADGIGRMWVDGNLVHSETSIVWSELGRDGATAEQIAGTREGWIYFKYGENQASPDNINPKYVDFDDIVVYNTTPPNTDTDGNAYIGPVGTTPTSSGTTKNGFGSGKWGR